MTETSSDDRLHVRLEWPADDQRAPARTRSRRPAVKGSDGASPRTTAKKEAPVTAVPVDEVPASPAPGPTRRPRPLQARPLQVSTRRTGRAATPRTRSPASRRTGADAVVPSDRSKVGAAPDLGLASSLPAVADQVDALTHALITLHSLVSDRMSDQSARLMDVIDGSVATLAHRDDEHARTLEDLSGQVQALREGQVEVVSALSELLQRVAPPPEKAEPRDEPPVSRARRRLSGWLSGVADSVGAPRPSGGGAPRPPGR